MNESQLSISNEFRDSCLQSLQSYSQRGFHERNYLRNDTDIQLLSAFDSDTILQIVAGLLQAKKMLFVADRGE